MKTTTILPESIDSLDKNSIAYSLMYANYKFRKDLMSTPASQKNSPFKADVGSTLFIYQGESSLPRADISKGTLPTHSERTSLVAAVNASLGKWGPFKSLSPSLRFNSAAELEKNTSVMEALKQLDEIHILSERTPCNFSKDPKDGDLGCEVYLDQLNGKLGGNKINSYSYLEKFTPKENAIKLLEEKFNALDKHFKSPSTILKNQQTQSPPTVSPYFSLQSTSPAKQLPSFQTPLAKNQQPQQSPQNLTQQGLSSLSKSLSTSSNTSQSTMSPFFPPQSILPVKQPLSSQTPLAQNQQPQQSSQNLTQQGPSSSFKPDSSSTSSTQSQQPPSSSAVSPYFPPNLPLPTPPKKNSTKKRKLSSSTSSSISSTTSQSAISRFFSPLSSLLAKPSPQSSSVSNQQLPQSSQHSIPQGPPSLQPNSSSISSTQSQQTQTQPVTPTSFSKKPPLPTPTKQKQSRSSKSKRLSASLSPSQSKISTFFSLQPSLSTKQSPSSPLNPNQQVQSPQNSIQQGQSNLLDPNSSSTSSTPSQQGLPNSSSSGQQQLDLRDQLAQQLRHVQQSLTQLQTPQPVFVPQQSQQQPLLWQQTQQQQNQQQTQQQTQQQQNQQQTQQPPQQQQNQSDPFIPTRPKK